MRRRPLRPRPLSPRRRPRRPVTSQVRHMLMRAQRLVDQAQFLEAAKIYDRLARGAYARGRIRPGIHMDLEAARAYLQGTDLEAARSRVIRAGHRAMVSGYPLQCRRLVEQITQDLEMTGQDEAAAQFRVEMAELLDDAPAEPDLEAEPLSSHEKLPGSCPACSAPLHPDELTWVASDRVTCPYCGTIVVAE